MARNFGRGRRNKLRFSARETKTEMETGIKIKRRGRSFGRNKMISSTLRTREGIDAALRLKYLSLQLARLEHGLAKRGFVGVPLLREGHPENLSKCKVSSKKTIRSWDNPK